jgi:hypothetical protein
MRGALRSGCSCAKVSRKKEVSPVQGGDIGRKLMKLNMSRTTLGVIFFAAIVSLVPSAQAGQCSQAGSAGNFGFTLTGVVILGTSPVPIAAVGRAALDAAGNVSGTESRSVGGGFADETFSGTYTVDADCTGTATLRFYESGQLARTSVLSIIFDSNEREIRMVQKSLQLPTGAFLPVVITVEAKRIFTNDED